VLFPYANAQVLDMLELDKPYQDGFWLQMVLLKLAKLVKKLFQIVNNANKLRQQKYFNAIFA
jgi:hypothetical protein